MQITELEQKLILAEKYPTIVVSSVGKDNAVGPIVATAVIYHYKNHPVLDLEAIAPSDLENEINLRLGQCKHTYVVSAELINEMKDVAVADAYARYRAVTNLLWTVYGSLRIAPKSLISNNSAYSDVVPNPSGATKYVVLKHNPELTSVHKIAAADIHTVQQGHFESPAILCAEFLSQVELNRLLKAADSKYPEYQMLKDVYKITKEHRAQIKLLGVSPEHRFNIKGYSRFRKRQSVAQDVNKVSGISKLDQEKYIKLFNSLNNS